MKVIKLESYEDTLNNLELIRTQQQEDLFGDLTPEQKDDYLMHYMLDLCTRQKTKKLTKDKA